MAASTPYLDNYLESLEYLPLDLKRNFTLMHDLDGRAQKMLQKADETSNELIQSIIHDDQFTDTDLQERIQMVKQSYLVANSLGEDKLQLATQSYELVDKYIRRLDINMTKFKKDIEASLAARGQPINKELVNLGVGSSISHKSLNTARIKKRTSSKVTNGESSTAVSNVTNFNIESSKKRLVSTSSSASSGEWIRDFGNASSSAGGNGSDDILTAYQMAVDPNEPTYCICSQVSYGEMIACDNPSCTIEWFHFGCVGLIMKPKGKWYCVNCLK